MRPITEITDAFARAVPTVLVCAALTFAPPVASPVVAASYLEQDLQEATGRLQRASKSLSESAYDVLRAQTEESLTPFATSLIDLVLNYDSEQLGTLVDLGFDTALSVPPDATAALRSAFAEISSDSCNLVPLPSTVFDRVLKLDAVAGANPTKRSQVIEQWKPVLNSVPRRDSRICLPSSSSELEKLLLAQSQALGMADNAAVRAFNAQAQVTLKSVKKGSSFRLYSETAKQQLNVLSRVSFADRDRFKKATAEYIDARAFVGVLKQKRLEGPPKCYTIGCKQFYENDIWRYNYKDDYTGEGLEKPDRAILKPAPFKFEGPP